MSVFEVGRLRGAGLKRWGNYVIMGGCLYYPEGLGLTVGTALGTQDTPSLSS